jgi:hypothetical protein
MLDPRLVNAISSPAIRGQALELVRLALLALYSLDKVDDSLYARFVATRAGDEDPETAAANMRKLWNDTFKAQQFLLAHCRKLDVVKRTPAVGVPIVAPPADLDFGDLEAPAVEKDFELELGDIGDLVDNLGAERPRSEAERWAGCLEKIASIRYALGGQYEDAVERMEVALGAGHTNQILGLLDELTSVSNEGIAALVMAVYEAFVSDADPTTVVPAYQTTLRRALMVRRGVAALHAELAPLNEVLQRNEEKDRHAEMAARSAAALHAFVETRTCRAMRAADRWELTQFDQRMQYESLREVRLTVEGLVKYLESLNVVNQREVLVQHDRQVADEVRDAISSARELAELSVTTAHEIVINACKRAQDLRGRSSAVDPMLEDLKTVAAWAKPDDIRTLIERLEEILATAGL